MTTATDTRAPRNHEVAVDLQQLRALPAPESMGPRHRPVPHSLIMDGLLDELERQGVQPTRYEFRLTQAQQRLDGTIMLDDPELAVQARERMIAKRDRYSGFVPEAEQELAGAMIGLSHANDQSRALRITQGRMVYVCTNLMVAPAAGSGLTLKRKHTGDEPWEERIKRLVTVTLEGFGPFNRRIEAMQNASLRDQAAKALILDAFTLKYPPLPPSHMPEVARLYFGHETDDVAGRNRYALHNAFTRAMGPLPLRRQQEGSATMTQLLSDDLVPALAREVESN